MINKFIKNKIHLNIGTIGHIDHGKTTLTLALQNYLAIYFNKKIKSFSDIDSSIEEKKRGITINTTHIEYETDKRHYSHVDCPGHADYIKNMITGASQMDCAILVVSAEDGIMPQTKEHILLAKQIGINNIIIFINKIDKINDEELIELIELEIKELLEQHNFKLDILFVKGSALKCVEDLKNNKLNSTWVKNLKELIDVMDNIPQPIRNLNKPFLMPIENIISITGRGTVVTGKIEQGSIVPNTSVDIVGFGIYKTIIVNSIEMFQKSLDKGEHGDNVGLLLKGINKNEIKKGMVLSKVNEIKDYSIFEAEVYILTPEEGGRKKPFFEGYKPQFFFKSINVTGTIVKLLSSINISENNKKMIIPGDLIKIEIHLLYPLAINCNLNFAIREGGLTIGAGVISKIIK
eukprot:GHVU01092762.1.p2 GENE.GHVU01092762.1~~GHVU01092762.1.p2  ORF type:complete len:406 (-),score=35.40 GHVU01092762.1:4519-5736(-)